MSTVATVKKASQWICMAVGLVFAQNLVAEPQYIGAQECAECHESSHDVWKETKHFSSFKDAHKERSARDIAKAVGGRNMKKTEICATCHYTVVEAKLDSGPSCESCHGPASEWVKIHNDYGGEGVKKEQETEEHRAQRIARSIEAGMIRPENLLGVAQNCNSCHGFGTDALSADTITAMVDAGHPLTADFELVRYANGSVRHRFYPPDVTVNKEMTEAEQAEMFVVGQIVALMTATSSIDKSDHPKFKEFQSARMAAAKAALGNIPEATAFVSNPTEAEAKKLVDMLPDVLKADVMKPLLPTEYK